MSRVAAGVVLCALAACAVESVTLNDIATVRVVPVYGNHPDWNDYVRRSDPSAERFNQPDVGCDPTVDALGGGPDNCIHAGELRRVAFSVEGVCAEFTIVDVLGVWEWACVDSEADQVEFYTVGLGAGRGLKNLVNTGGFLANRVEIRNSRDIVVARSAQEVWGWENTVVPLPNNAEPADGLLRLEQEGYVYVVDGDRDTAGINISADRVSLVTLRNSTLLWNGNTSPTCDVDTGFPSEPGSMGTNVPVLLCGGNRDFVWLESSIRSAGATPPQRLMVFVRSRFMRMHGLSSVDNESSTAAIRVVDVTHSRLTDIVSRGSGDDGIQLWDSSYNELAGLNISGSVDNGLVLRHRTTLGAGATGSHHNVVRDVWVHDVGRNGVILVNCTDDPSVCPTESNLNGFNRLHEIRVESVRGSGLAIWSSDNRLYDITTANVGGGPSLSAGLDFRNGGRNIVVRASAFNNFDVAVRICCPGFSPSPDNVLSQVLAQTTASPGIFFQEGADRTTLSHVTAVGPQLDSAAEQTGILQLNGVLGATVNNLLAIGGGWGVRAGGFPVRAEELRAVNIATVDGNGGINLRQDSINNQFSGALLMAAARCEVLAGASGVVDPTCTSTGVDGSSDYPLNPDGSRSTATLYLGATSEEAFVGRVDADDEGNASDTSGLAIADEIADWTSLENRFRTWGKDGSSHLSNDTASYCAPGTNCRIWDWRLRVTDPLYLNFFGPFVEGEPCPASVHGDVVLTDRVQWPWVDGIHAVENLSTGGNGDGVCQAGELCSNRFLLNAVEIAPDGLGDDDGLCESQEHCIYAPNLGVYQGSDLLGECVFQDGDPDFGVSGVVMWGFQRNGE